MGFIQRRSSSRSPAKHVHAEEIHAIFEIAVVPSTQPIF
jgi:hypothetical protein